LRVSLSTFAEFVGASPASKTTCIEKFRASPQTYDPRTDYYKQLREFIPRNHRRGGTPKELLKFAEGVDRRKTANYQSRAGAYIRWWGRRTVRWTGGPGRTWESGGVEVAPSPEIVAAFNDVRHIAKLYFKKERLSSDRADTILRLLQLAYGNGPVIVVLDLAHDLVFEPEGPLGHLDLYLAGEAASFRAMAEQL
jgi:hypothetical protein